MSWWPSSWLPALPSLDFTLPTGIQKRFISFALRQTLGHLLKPGQLDSQQIDSQIGSGYVQIRDVELDNNAINSLLSGLPVQLHDGSIGRVTARVPLPNPLTSSVGLTLESLHLTFYLTPAARSKRPSTTNLAESVVSVADTFIHEELSPGEEATLRESLHPDLSPSTESLRDHVPGGLDPFVTDDDEPRVDSDPAGVSLFATLLERLLSRFEFEASDTRITLVHPEHASFTFSVPQIRYSTEPGVIPDKSPSPSPASSSRGSGPVHPEGVSRTVAVSGVTLTTRCLRPPSPQAISASTLSASYPHFQHLNEALSPPSSPPPSSPISSSSDIDHETELMMSQSIVALPPRPISPTNSVASSMYQSAVSTADACRDAASRHLHYSSISSPLHHQSTTEEQADAQPNSTSAPRPALEVDTRELEDEMLLSFGTEPILFRLTTPPAVSKPPSESSAASSEPPSSPNPCQTRQDSSKYRAHSHDPQDDKLRASVTVGVIACALRARHIRSIIDFAEAWNSRPPVPSSSRGDQGNGSSSTLGHLEITLRVRGVVMVLLPVKGAMRSDADERIPEFFAHPLVPPQSPRGFVRVHLDGLSGTVTTQQVVTQHSNRTIVEVIHRVPSGRATTCTVRLSDISVFAFVASGGRVEGTLPLSASPILITDPHLPSQYPSAHVQPRLSPHSQFNLPAFEVVDWTDSSRRTNAAKPSMWRTRAQHVRPPSAQASPMSYPETLPSTSPGRSPPIGLASSSGRAPLPGLSASPGKSGESVQRPSQSAMTVKLYMISPYAGPRPSQGKKSTAESVLEVEVSMAPLHCFVDAGLSMGGPEGSSQLLDFLEEVASGTSEASPAGEEPTSGAEGSEDEDDEYTPPGTPRPDEPFGLRAEEREQERERRRLERLVLEDLDLGFDYTQKVPQKSTSRSASRVQSWHKRKSQNKAKSNSAIVVKLPMIRVELRGPPPPSRSPRSGAVILDIHDLRLSPDELPHEERDISVRFSGAQGVTNPDQVTSSENAGKVLVSADWRRIVIAYCPLGERKANAILSLGSLPASDVTTMEEGSPFGHAAASQRMERQSRPRIVVSQSDSAPESSNAGVTTLAVALDIPSVSVNLSKPELDGLQLWADDLSQLAERVLNGSAAQSDAEMVGSENPSLIGSQYFVKMRRSRGSRTDSGSTSSSIPSKSRSETIVKVAVSEVAVRLALPRQADGGAVRPFDVRASDLDLLLEVKPEGRDETVITLGIMDISLTDTTTSGSPVSFFTLTIPRSMTSSPRPWLKLRFTSLVVPGTTAKESRVKVTLTGILYDMYPNFEWASDLGNFAKAPPGAFESVVPSERTRISVKMVDASLRARAPKHPGATILYMGELDFGTDVVGGSPEMSFELAVGALSLFLIDDIGTTRGGTSAVEQLHARHRTSRIDGATFWKIAGYSMLAELAGLVLEFSRDGSLSPASTKVTLSHADLRLHLCADTMTAMTSFISDLTSAFGDPSETQPDPAKMARRRPTAIATPPPSQLNIVGSLDDRAFQRMPEVGAAPDMISDDLPTNMDYLDESFGAAAGLRELDDDDLDEFGSGVNDSMIAGQTDQPGIISRYGGETIRMLQPQGLRIVEHYYETMHPDSVDDSSQYGDTTLRVRIHGCDVTLFLYDGYDWARTRRIIEEEAKEMRRRLAKIRQLVASGQTPDPSVEETNTLLFNSVYIGLEHNVDELEPGALIAAIDEELNDEFETTSQSSWQSLKPQQTSPGRSGAHPTPPRRKYLSRAKGPSIEFRLQGLDAEVDNYREDPSLSSRTLVTVREVEILDHIKTSTWKKFLTDLRADSRGNIRETGSNMARVELRKVFPVPGNPTEEARLRAKLLPLRLHVDQDALDFLKKFFSFKDSDSLPPQASDPADEIYFQQAEVFPVDIKLDYKPRRVDYRALREGRTIELMNFFHFDGAEMTLRHITLTGITGWPRFFDLLNDLWTPDVKATQLVDVISGVSPIRSVVNVGSGVADLVLLPIAQYRKDGRVVRGLQKGTTAFVKSTATEAIKLGARLATGTQVILEQTETVLGGQFKDTITAEALQASPSSSESGERLEGDEGAGDLISRYADQPTNVKEGVRSAYKSLKKNFNSAAQTILAVPMEVYERSGNEGPVRAVVRAVPIAVLKPMIGASEAVSKTLLGLHNTLDPNVRYENEEKYKHR